MFTFSIWAGCCLLYTSKAYEQCAGFLRIPNGKNVLDNTSVHPESYDAAKKILGEFGYTLSDVCGHKLQDLPGKIKAAGEGKVAESCGIGIPTLRDITNAVSYTHLPIPRNRRF